HGCSVTRVVTISQPVLLNSSINSTGITCPGGNDGTISITGATGGYGTYEYSINGGASWQSSGTFTGIAVGTYNVQIRDAAHTNCVVTLNSAYAVGLIEQCIVCSGTTITVDQNVTINFNTNPPTYSGDADLQPYFTYDNSGATADTWYATFDVGANKILIKNGATITVTQVGSGSNKYAPGIHVVSTCTMEIENGGHVVVNSLNRDGGDIVADIKGDITINGEVRNEVSGTNGLPGAITLTSSCGNMNV